MTQRSDLDTALKQIEFARAYTWGLLDDLPDEAWFRQPAEGITHIAWQVGHLAMAQYGLCLFRIRGRRAEDASLMSGRFRKQFSKGSTPNPSPEENPTPAEIREVLQAVHKRAMRELAEIDLAVLDEPVEEPYAVRATRLGALYFCADHEMMHAGQIGLLRRLLGYAPIR
jgi:uncharacterized damage-inducible protein DinB